MNRRARWLLLARCGVSALVPSTLVAQQPDPDPGATPLVALPEALTPEPPETTTSPGGAFLRSVLVPGWGHVATESYARAGFYVTAQSATLWMLWQTLDRRALASESRALERQLVAKRIESGGLSNPDSIQIEVGRDPAVQQREALVESRDQQVEDWSALSIFLVLIGAVDAYVAAHLAEYPDPLTFRVLPVGRDRAEIQMSIPLNRIPLPGLWRN